MRTKAYYALAIMLTTALVGCVGDYDLEITYPPDEQTHDAVVTAETFEWRGAISPGHALEIKAIRGDIRVIQGSGPELEVLAEKTSSKHDVRDVRIDVVRHRHGITICAVYPTRVGSPPNTCRPGAQGFTDTHDNDIEVAFHVELPRGVDFVGRTVAGDVDVIGIADNAFGYSVGGNVNLRVGGVAEGSTVAGSITARLGATDLDRDLSFGTIAGHVTVELPPGVNARVEAEALNGRLTSDFALEQERLGRWVGTIGAGGPTLALSSLTGDVRIRKAR